MEGACAVQVHQILRRACVPKGAASDVGVLALTAARPLRRRATVRMLANTAWHSLPNARSAGARRSDAGEHPRHYVRSCTRCRGRRTDLRTRAHTLGIPLSPRTRLPPRARTAAYSLQHPGNRPTRPPAAPAPEPLRRNDMRRSRVLRSPPRRAPWRTAVHRLRRRLVLMLMSKTWGRAGRARASEEVLILLRRSSLLRQRMGARRARASVGGSWLVQRVRRCVCFVCQGGVVFSKIDLSVLAISARLSIPGNDSRYTRWASCLGVLMMQLMLRKGWRAQVNGLGFVLYGADAARRGARDIARHARRRN